VALRFGDRVRSFREFVGEASRRAHLFEARRDRDRPPHIGVLLDNEPDYLFWLGAVVVGITRPTGVTSSACSCATPTAS
jgi:fatty-acyl-CoA synthase